MKYFQLVAFFMMLTISVYSQNQAKCGNTVLVGCNGLVAVFNDTSYPYIRMTYDSISNQFNFRDDLSSISNPTTGLPMLYCNSNKIYDTLGNVIMNGDLLTDSILYNYYYYGNFPQQSIFLPLDSDKYVLLVNNLTDSAFVKCWLNNQCGGLQQHFDELRYNLIDMQANNGQGAVVVKNKILEGKVKMKMSQMSACRHANGKDWWVLRPGVDSFTMYRYLITKDSVFGPYAQYWDNQEGYFVNRKGQLSFSLDGTLCAGVLIRNMKLVVGNFDRCTGILSNERIFNTPLNVPDDTITFGVAFSPNKQFVYVSKRQNVYQLDLNDPDSNTAWYIVKQGCDSLYNNMCYMAFGTLYEGLDNRIYVGHTPGNTGSNFSSINKPDLKGAACDWCNQCLKCPAPVTQNITSTFANQPNYALGPLPPSDCFPANVESLPKDLWSVVLYPNPNHGNFQLKSTKMSSGEFCIMSMLGQVLYKSSLVNESFVHTIELPQHIHAGFYTYKYTTQQGEVFCGKLAIEK